MHNAPYSALSDEGNRRAPSAGFEPSSFRYRDKQQREVDIVIERHDGDIVGIAIKASATPATADFTGLRYLRDTLGLASSEPSTPAREVQNDESRLTAAFE